MEVFTKNRNEGWSPNIPIIVEINDVVAKLFIPREIMLTMSAWQLFFLVLIMDILFYLIGYDFKPRFSFQCFSTFLFKQFFDFQILF